VVFFLLNSFLYLIFLMQTKIKSNYL
jgi:hypothetical protein